MPDRTALPPPSPSEPPAAASLAAVVLEPGIAVLGYFAACAWFDVPIGRHDLALGVLLLALGLPGRDRWTDAPGSAAIDIALAWAGRLALLALAGAVTSSVGLFDLRVLLAWALATPAAQWLAVRTGQQLWRHGAAPAGRTRVVVVGAGPHGAQVAAALAGGADPAIEVVGYFDDRADERIAAGATVHRLGALRDCAGFVGEHRIDEVCITLPLGSQSRIVDLLQQLRSTSAAVSLAPDAFASALLDAPTFERRGLLLIGIGRGPFGATGAIVKRSIDLVLASVAVALAAPLLLAVAAAIRLGSPGPAIVGRRMKSLFGEDVVMHRFRTTRLVDEAAALGDSRPTAVGAWLRRTSIERWPQLIDVLQGRMSLVGPRAHAVASDPAYRRLIGPTGVRSGVKPGLTGWAQVHGHRAETDDPEVLRDRIGLDLAYLRRWTPALDLRIVVQALFVPFGSRDAE